MPDEYGRADVVHNVQRAALLGAALASGRLDLLRAAVRDRLHQPYRAAMVPGLDEMLALDDPARRRGRAVRRRPVGPGAGSRAARRQHPERIGRALGAIFARHGVRSTVLTPALASAGLVLVLAEPA